MRWITWWISLESGNPHGWSRSDWDQIRQRDDKEPGEWVSPHEGDKRPVQAETAKNGRIGAQKKNRQKQKPNEKSRRTGRGPRVLLWIDHHFVSCRARRRTGSRKAPGRDGRILIAWFYRGARNRPGVMGMTTTCPGGGDRATGERVQGENGKGKERTGG